MADSVPGASDRNRRIIRLIQRWLKAGVLEDGIVTVSGRGTGQGSVISPLLANIYLHYALDLGAVRWRRREATGDMIIVRYADDFIIGYQRESDARRFLDEMRERRGLGKPETFNFLGFTFIAAKPVPANSRSNGRADGTACGRSSR
jgi:RNA-directed DNA polymerase